MEPMLETINLDLEEDSELLFKVKIEGTEAAPAKIRLVCEAGDVAYMFNGHATQEDGVIQFMLPALNGKLKEGLYTTRVEVLIENRYFAPVEFNINFKKVVKVVAEAIQVPRRQIPQVSVTASPVIVKKPVLPPVVTPKPFVQQKVVATPVAPVLRTTLKERYAKERDEVIDDVDSVGEDLIRELAQSFARKKR